MLPHSPSIGICESFGTNSILFPKVSENGEGIPKLSFDAPIMYTDNPKRLQVINTTSIKTRNFSSVSHSKIDETVKLNELERMEDLIKRNNLNAFTSGKNMTETTDVILAPMFDPTVSTLCKPFELDGKMLIAAVTGSSANYLAFGVLNSSYFSPQHDTKTSYGKPFISWQSSINIKSPILQIETYVNDDECLVLVRTSIMIHLLKCNLVKSNICLKKVFKFEKGEKWANFADTTLQISNDELKLVVVDCIGKFKVFTALNTRKKLEFVEQSLKFSSFYEPTELSNFKKSVWIDSKRLILFSRSQLHEYRFTSYNPEKQEKLFCRICASIWSKLLDLQQSLQDPSYFYLLTTKELMLVDTSKGFRKVLGWKHYYNDTDTSMTLQVVRSPDDPAVEMCIVTSKQINISYVHEFNLEFLKFVNTPYLLVPSGSNARIQSTYFAAIKELDDSFLCIQKLEDNTIVASILQYTGKIENNQKSTSRTQKMDQQQHIPIKIPNFDIEERRSIVESLVDYTREVSKVGETKKLYDNLNDFLKDEGKSFSSLFQIISDLKIPTKIKNIDHLISNMVEKSSYEKYNFVINENQWLTDRNLSLNDVNIEKHSEAVHEFFKKLKKSQAKHLTSSIEYFLFASLIGLEKNQKALDYVSTEKEIQTDMMRLPREQQQIVDSFQNDFDVDTDDDVSTFTQKKSVQRNIPLVNASQVPQISQSQSKKSKTKNRLKKQTMCSGGFSSQVSKPPYASQLQPSQFDKQNVDSVTQNTQDTQSSLGSQTMTQTPVSSQALFSQASIGRTQKSGPKKKKRRMGF